MTAEEDNLKIMEKLSNYAKWQYSVLEGDIYGDVLEIGSGVGTITEFIFKDQSVKSVTCLEINENHLSTLKNKFGDTVIILNHNIENDPNINSKIKFDSIICMNVIEHIENDQKFFKNCVENLNLNGKLVFLVPALMWNYGSVDDSDNHFRRYEINDLISMCRANDLRILELKYFNFLGMIGWWYHGKVLKLKVHEKNELGLFDRLVPLLSRIESVITPPIGLSLILVAEKKV